MARTTGARCRASGSEARLGQRGRSRADLLEGVGGGGLELAPDGRGEALEEREVGIVSQVAEGGD